MESPRVREFEFSLPIGYEDSDGRMHRTAVLRKMTGREEALIADKNNRANGARLITELLGSCLLRIGSVDRPGKQVVQSLYSADRHFLLVKLREITFGAEIQTSYSCPTCKEATTSVENLSELEVICLQEGETPHDIVVQLEDGYFDRDGQLYTSMVFRYPTGGDEEKVATAIRENAAAGKNALLSRCLKSVGDMPDRRREALGTALFSDLTLGDRARIDKTLNNGGPGINMRREINCDGCGRKYTATLDMSNFLSPS